METSADTQRILRRRTTICIGTGTCDERERGEACFACHEHEQTRRGGDQRRYCRAAGTTVRSLRRQLQPWYTWCVQCFCIRRTWILRGVPAQDGLLHASCKPWNERRASSTRTCVGRGCSRSDTSTRQLGRVARETRGARIGRGGGGIHHHIRLPCSLESGGNCLATAGECRGVLPSSSGVGLLSALVCHARTQDLLLQRTPVHCVESLTQNARRAAQSMVSGSHDRVLQVGNGTSTAAGARGKGHAKIRSACCGCKSARNKRRSRGCVWCRWVRDEDRAKGGRTTIGRETGGSHHPAPPFLL
mmetsp:Transcript_1410/g.8681  ORF Transcript_1410/g.8681 Transcript_1410/m.8681 type:complete len:303 (+) Transcript_1410:3653-4561(+)